MARSSAYGQMISQLPNWVLKGEFGDISNLLNRREQEYEQTQNAQLINDLNQMKLEEQQRQADFDEELRRRDIFGGNSDEPLTLRDMYGRVRDVAREMGNIDEVLKFEERLQKLQEAQAQDERQKLLQGRQDEEWGWKVQDRKTRGSGGSAGGVGNEIKGADILISPDGQPELVRKSEYNAKIESGYIDPDLQDMIKEIRAERERASKSEQKTEPGAMGRFFEGLFGGDKPGDKPAQAQQDLVDQIKQSAPPRAPRPGMKWQRNKKTGELREVPA